MDSLSNQLTMVGAPAPAITEDMPAEKKEIMSMDVSIYSTEELEDRVEKLYSLSSMVGLLRAKYLREIRRREYPVTGEGRRGSQDARMGWSIYVRDKFGAQVQKVNREIDGLEAIEAAQATLAGKTEETIAIGADANQRTDFNSYELQQLGTAKPEVRPALAEALITGEIAGGREVKKAEKELTTVNVTPKPPSMKKAPPSLQIKPPSERSYSLAKWRKVEEVQLEMDWMQDHLRKMREHAMAYKNACQKLNDRLEDAQAKNRNWPAVMTVMAQVWTEREFDFDGKLNEVAKLIEVANAEYREAMALSHGAANITD